MRLLRFAVLSGFAATALAGPARAEPRVEVVAKTCEDRVATLERGLAETVQLERSRGLSASVRFDRVEAGIRATVTMRENSLERGETVLVVSSCDEAVDAVVVVLSLALGSEPSAAITSTASLRDEPDFVTPPEPEGPPMHVSFVAPARRRDEAPASDTSHVASLSVRLSLAGGVDLGTLPTPAAFVGGGITRSWPLLEVRGSLRYGLPTTDERVETDVRESVQRDFGTLGLSLCRGVGKDVRLTLCAGCELGLVRATRRVALDGWPTIDEDEISPRFSGELATLLSFRQGWIRPEFELSASALALGDPESASPVAFRAAAGASVDF